MDTYHGNMVYPKVQQEIPQNIIFKQILCVCVCVCVCVCACVCAHAYACTTVLNEVKQCYLSLIRLELLTTLTIVVKERLAHAWCKLNADIDIPQFIFQLITLLVKIMLLPTLNITKLSF